MLPPVSKQLRPPDAGRSREAFSLRTFRGRCEWVTREARTLNILGKN